MYRYSKAAESPSCVYVKMRLESGDVYYPSVEMYFLYDCKNKCVRYSTDGLVNHETIITDFNENVNIEDMFTEEPAPFVIYDVPCFYFFVKSGGKKRRYGFERHDDIIKYHNSYRWVVNLFEKICKEGKLINRSVPIPPPIYENPVNNKEEPVEYLTGIELIESATPKDDDGDIEFYVAFNDKDGFPIKKPKDAYSFNIAMYSKKTGERLNECYGARLIKKVDDNEPEVLK